MVQMQKALDIKRCSLLNLNGLKTSKKTKVIALGYGIAISYRKAILFLYNDIDVNIIPH